MTGPEPIEPTAGETGEAAPVLRPYDPERGLRGAMSAALVLQAIVVLLAIPVAANTGDGTSWFGIVLICLLAVVLIGLCAFVSRPWFVPAVLVVQALTIVGWLISPALGLMGVVFGLAWATILWFRAEFRRRLAAGTLPKAAD